MPGIRETHLQQHLSDDALKERFESSTDIKHRERFQMLWLIQERKMPAVYAAKDAGSCKKLGSLLGLYL